MLESALEAIRTLYELVAGTYAATWFPIVERVLLFLIDTIPAWLVEAVTLLLFSTGAATRYANHSYELGFERLYFDPFRDRLSFSMGSPSRCTRRRIDV